MRSHPFLLAVASAAVFGVDGVGGYGHLAVSPNTTTGTASTPSAGLPRPTIPDISANAAARTVVCWGAAGLAIGAAWVLLGFSHDHALAMIARRPPSLAAASATAYVYPAAMRRGLVRRPPRLLPAAPQPTTTPLRRSGCARCLHLQTRGAGGLVRLEQRRSLASVAPATATTPATATEPAENSDDIGPLEEYDRRVAAGRLRNDEHQRGIIQSLQRMHDELRHYHAPPVVHPDLASLKPRPKKTSFLRGLLGGGSDDASAGVAAAIGKIPDNLPKGLYLYGDVGSGKTMLMDLFYDTLPRAVHSKLRIHFHNFMQDVHKRLHRIKMQHGNDVDAVPFVAADLAELGNVLCFDEFQCTDVADAMILRRLLEALMSHGVVLVTTSNRHPDELYKNGVQRESFLPAIALLKQRLHVINLDSPTDYRKIPRPPSGVYHTPLDAAAAAHAERWFRYLGDRDPAAPPPHPEVQTVWGREIRVPRVSGRCAWFTFDELIGQPTSAADYLELVRAYDAFVVTDVPGMTHHQRDLARRFITFIDAVYEAQAKLVLTTEVPLKQLFVSKDEIRATLQANRDGSSSVGDGAGASTGLSTAAARAAAASAAEADDASDSQVEAAMDQLIEGMEGHNIVAELKHTNLFTGEEEAFAFGRALSRLTQMGSREWVERGLEPTAAGNPADKASQAESSI